MKNDFTVTTANGWNQQDYQKRQLVLSRSMEWLMAWGTESYSSVMFWLVLYLTAVCLLPKSYLQRYFKLCLLGLKNGLWDPQLWLFGYKADSVWIKLNHASVLLYPGWRARLRHLSDQRQGMFAQPQLCMPYGFQSRAGFHFANSEYLASTCMCRCALSTRRCSQACRGIWRMPRDPAAGR